MGGDTKGGWHSEVSLLLKRVQEEQLAWWCLCSVYDECKSQSDWYAGCYLRVRLLHSRCHKCFLAGKALINRGSIGKAFLDRDYLEAIITGYGTVVHLTAECGKLKCSTSRKKYKICEECRCKKWETVVRVVRVEYRGLGPTGPESRALGA